MSNVQLNSFGIDRYGAKLEINPIIWPTFMSLCFIDIETDEKDNFVGLGIGFDDKEVYYFTQLTEKLKEFLSNTRLVGHNLKFDAKLLVKWGINISPQSLFGDTILMSYSYNTTKESHSLKDIGKELGYDWPSYRDIVGKGRSKKTLDKQNTELVANYCAMDVLVTYKLYHWFKQHMNINQLNIYNAIEIPLMKILFEMELKGVKINVKQLQALDSTFRGKLLYLVDRIQNITKSEINPNSNKQIGAALIKRGYQLPKTSKGNFKVDKWVLENYKEDEFVNILLEYNKLEKLWSTYTQGFLKLSTLPRIHTTYNQISQNFSAQIDKGISTGRLSSSKPNLQQIPVKTEEGKNLRELFIPEEGNVLIDADYSQIEYRLLAHFTQEPLLLEAFRNEKDVHEETGRALGCDRDTGKTLNFASIYGAGAKKIARTAKCSEIEAQSFLDLYWQRLPNVTAWVNRVKYEAKQKKGIYTLMKRWIPIPKIMSKDLYERYHYERAAVNYIIQGSAAEIIKLAMINLRKKRYLPILTVHDELLFEINKDYLIKDFQAQHHLIIKTIMESVTSLSIPLIVDIGIGVNWRTAKGE